MYDFPSRAGEKCETVHFRRRLLVYRGPELTNGDLDETTCLPPRRKPAVPVAFVPRPRAPRLHASLRDEIAGERHRAAGDRLRLYRHGRPRGRSSWVTGNQRSFKELETGPGGSKPPGLFFLATDYGTTPPPWRSRGEAKTKVLRPDGPAAHAGTGNGLPAGVPRTASEPPAGVGSSSTEEQSDFYPTGCGFDSRLQPPRPLSRGNHTLGCHRATR